MTVIKLQARESLLKRRLRAHFRALGFKKDPDGFLLLPDASKDTYRKLHEAQRIEKFNNNKQFIDQNAKSLLGYLASGKDIDPSGIRPRLELINGGTWQSNLFRFVTHYWSVPVSEGYGRRMRFLVWDDANGKLIGVIALGDAVFNLRARDELVGWNHEQRKERMANILDAYVLGAVPPYNFLLCGKLVASLIKTKEVVDAFRTKYGESIGIISGKKKSPNLVLVTTTSSMGRSSVYNRLKLDNEQFLERIGFTSGWGHFHIPDHLFELMRIYLTEKGDPYANNHGFGQGPNWRLRAIRKSFSLLGMNNNLARHGLVREVFVSHIAKNSIPFLMGEATTPDYSTLRSVSEVAELARNRWIIPRAARRPEYLHWSADGFVQTFCADHTMFPKSKIL